MAKYGDISAESEKAQHQPEHEWVKNILDYITMCVEQEEKSHRDIRNIREHNLRVARQYYWLRWIISAVAASAPLLILYFVLDGIRHSAYTSAHPAAQALLVSGAFIGFIVLYGFMLQGLFRALKDKSVMDYSQNHPHNDIDESMEKKFNDDFMPGAFKEFLKSYKNPGE